MGEKRKAEDELARAGTDHNPDSEKFLAQIKMPPALEGAASRDLHFAKLYDKVPDFKELARLDPDFAKLLNANKESFFEDPDCVMQLTKTLLKLDFGLKIELPNDRLCPPVTNRHNYILWLKGLLDTTSYDNPRRNVVGLDIGTGASCIYPLLGCTQRPWSFFATDIDHKSLGYAKKNVALNDFENQINIIERSPEDSIIPVEKLGTTPLDFTMTNPPFYKSEDEMLESAAKKSRLPFTACTGTKTEMVAEGGEMGFVERILKESLDLRERVQWYTAMFGFLSSLTDFISKLHHHEIDNYAVTEFIQGNKTRRWAVAWSFGAMRPSQEFARGIKTAVPKSVLPPVTEVEVTHIPLTVNISEFSKRFSTSVQGLELMSWEWDRSRLEGLGRAADKVWTRSWRRRKQREAQGQVDGTKSKTAEETCVFAFQIRIRVRKDDALITCRWVEGRDSVAFDSFKGFLQTAAKSVLESRN